MSNRLPTLRESGGIGFSAIQPRFAPVRNYGNLRNPGEDFLASMGLGSLTPLGAKVTELTALGISTVFACVDYIASILATLPIELYRTRPDGTKETADGHPVRRLMKTRPNPVMVSSDVRYALAFNQALHGNAYAQIVWNRANRPVEIYPVKSRDVTMWIEGGFPKYRIANGAGSRVENFSRILHLRGMTAEGLTGRGPLGVAANLLGLAQALEENASRFFSNGSRPGMIYSTPPGVALTEPQKASMREQLNSLYQGVENFFRTIILEGGGKIEMARSSNEESQFDEIKRATHVQICQLFRVPPHKVQLLDKATFSNIEQQQIQAVQDLFLPWCKRWEETFAGALLLPEEQESYYFKHNLNGILRGDVVTRYQAHSVALQNGIMSINEVRGLEDLDPIEGGNTHVRQLNMTDINAPAAAPAKPAEAA